MAWRLFQAYPRSARPLHEGAIVLIDEIDLHLHPRWQRSLRRHLTHHFPGTQFIATTHSPITAQETLSAGGNVAVVRWEGDHHAVILNNPLPAREWRFDQVLTSDLFGFNSSRGPIAEAQMNERLALLRKGKLTVPEQRRLAELDAFAADLPTGRTPEEQQFEDLEQTPIKLYHSRSRGSNLFSEFNRLGIPSRFSPFGYRSNAKPGAARGRRQSAMIRIAKGTAPRRLIEDGGARTRTDCRACDSDPASYQSGASTFRFEKGIYNHPTVRRALERAQHGKCCYCEALLPKPYAYWHVEHWRPKAYSKQSNGTERLFPGYYWLAYDWDNLFLACPFCNTSNKGNIFPLFNPDDRARSHRTNLALEKPMLLKPDEEEEDPRDHIGFHEEVPVGMTPRGKRTVEVLGLDRTEHEERLRLLNRLKECCAVVAKYRDDPSPAALELVGKARAFVQHATRPASPFSAMAMAFVERNRIPP